MIKRVVLFFATTQKAKLATVAKYATVQKKMNYREILGSSKKVVGRKFRQTTKKELVPIWNRLIEKVLNE